MTRQIFNLNLYMNFFEQVFIPRHCDIPYQAGCGRSHVFDARAPCSFFSLPSTTTSADASRPSTSTQPPLPPPPRVGITIGSLQQFHFRSLCSCCCSDRYLLRSFARRAAAVAAASGERGLPGALNVYIFLPFL
jgi:hypothetical protein